MHLSLQPTPTIKTLTLQINTVRLPCIVTDYNKKRQVTTRYAISCYTESDQEMFDMYAVLHVKFLCTMLTHLLSPNTGPKTMVSAMHFQCCWPVIPEQ